MTPAAALPLDPVAGDFWRTRGGRWWVCDPLGHVDSVAMSYLVAEDDDGMITVVPAFHVGACVWTLEHGLWEAL